MERIIIAGHYCLSPNMKELSYDQPTEERSFLEGIRKYIQKNNCCLTRLILWVNDIGIPPDERKNIKDNYVIPSNYLDILKKYNLNEDDLEICFESTIRNKASVLVRKIKRHKPELFRTMHSLDNNLVRCVGKNDLCKTDIDKKAYVIDGPDGENLVVKEGPNPKCNLILATLIDKYSTNHTEIFMFMNSIYEARLIF